MDIRVTRIDRQNPTEGAPVEPVIVPSLNPKSGDSFGVYRGQWDASLIISRPHRRGPGYLPYRFGIGYVDETGECRRVYQGPIEPGPYAYTYGLSVGITADPSMSTAAEHERNAAQNLEIQVEDGQLLQLGFHLFRVRYVRDQWIELDHVGPTRVYEG